MSGTFKSRALLGEPVEPRMVKWLVKKKIVKSKRTAGGFLVLVIIISLTLTAIISSQFIPGASKLTAHEIEKIQNFEDPSSI